MILRTLASSHLEVFRSVLEGGLAKIKISEMGTLARLASQTGQSSWRCKILKRCKISKTLVFNTFFKTLLITQKRKKPHSMQFSFILWCIFSLNLNNRSTDHCEVLLLDSRKKKSGKFIYENLLVSEGV